MVVVGIDLGTSNSLIGYWDKTQVQLIANSAGSLLTPSVVGVDDDGQLLVGALAAARRYTHAADTALEFKRQMGTAMQYHLGDTTYSATELSALVLKSLREDAERALGSPVDTAVISVPAYFNNQQREATIQAGRLAGLQVQQIISEPTAAALAYGLHKTDAERFLVLDLGGGTFDVSLLDMFEGVVQVQAIAGDNYLGGQDFTRALIDAFVQAQALETTLTPADEAQLYSQFETIKKMLTETEIVTTTINYRHEDHPYRLTRGEFAELVAPLLARMLAPIMRTLHDTALTVDDIDRVLLVGGASRMPAVRQFIAHQFRRIPDTRLEPDLTIALGAAIQTQLETDEALKAEMIMTDVSAYTLGIEIAADRGNGEIIYDRFSPIIERNMPIPISITHDYQTLSDSGTLDIEIYQGEAPQASQNLHIATLHAKMPMVRHHDFKVRFSYDTNGVLEAEVLDAQAVIANQTITNEGTTLSDEDIAASLAKLEAFKRLPADRTENRLVLAELERLYAASLGRTRDTIQSAIVDFTAVLAHQDPTEIQQFRESLQAFINRLNHHGFNA